MGINILSRMFLMKNVRMKRDRPSHVIQRYPFVPSFRFACYSFLFAIALMFSSAKAIIVDFDAGYSPDGGMGGGGSLRDQPSTGTRWTGGAPGKIGSIVVTANDGASGKDCSARTQAGN